jgi:hypothetical protein
MSGGIADYVRKVSLETETRLIAAIPKQEADRLDAWRIAAGMPSSTAAVGF